MRIPKLPLALALLLIPACGEDNQTISQLRFCDEYAQAACAQVVPACLLVPTECQANRVNECIAAGRVSTELGQAFIPANAEACLAKVKEVYGKLNQGPGGLKPLDLQAMNETCAVVYRGPATRNQACAMDADCTDGFICDKAHCGVVTMVAPGEGCANVGERCPIGFYCGSSTGILACEAKAVTNIACDENTPCLESLHCSGGVCVNNLALGESCVADAHCATGYCEPYAGKCASGLGFAPGSGVCEALKTARGAGPGPAFP